MCVPKSEVHNILTFCHSCTCGGHFGGLRIAVKVLSSGLYWPILFRDTHDFYLACKRCQCRGALFRRDTMLFFPYSGF